MSFVNFYLNPDECYSRLSKVLSKTGASPKSSYLNELLAAADQIKPDSPAYLSVVYYQTKLLVDSGKIAEANQKLETIFAHNFDKLPASIANAFIDLRLRLANNFNTFLQYACKHPAAKVPGDTGNDLPDNFSDVEKGNNYIVNAKCFDDGITQAFNSQIPISMWNDLLASSYIPADLKNK